jgi:hypothetical protein
LKWLLAANVGFSEPQVVSSTARVKKVLKTGSWRKALSRHTQRPLDGEPESGGPPAPVVMRRHPRISTATSISLGRRLNRPAVCASGRRARCSFPCLASMLPGGQPAPALQGCAPSGSDRTPPPMGMVNGAAPLEPPSELATGSCEAFDADSRMTRLSAWSSHSPRAAASLLEST